MTNFVKLALFSAMASAPALFLTPAAAKDMVATPSQWSDDVRHAIVWERPRWLTADFKFNGKLDPLQGSPLKFPWTLVQKSSVSCLTNQVLLNDLGSGKTSKFRCELLDENQNKVLSKNGEPVKLKVKYGSTTEIFAEVAATRLIEALGFQSDRMFYVDKTFCFGCGEDPKKSPRLDTSTLSQPRLFEGTSIERKHDGDEILRERPGKTPRAGWTWNDLMKLGPADPAAREEQMIQRDALRLLAVFLEHTDNKSENQRLVCVGKTANGVCQGKLMMFIQDAGIAFGGGLRLVPPQITHFSLKKWRSRRFWSEPETCVSNIGLTETFTMINPRMSEEGRQFLVKLLDAFTAGSAGRDRVRDLFKAGHFERAGQGTIEDWTDAFYARFEQMKYPMGRENPGFKCPLRASSF